MKQTSNNTPRNVLFFFFFFTSPDISEGGRKYVSYKKEISYGIGSS